ncbi:MAG: glycosyltransferase family 4 protein [Candidatus Odinarchaeia archaeon]
MSDSPHVLVLAEIYPPDMGGGGTRASNVVKGLVMNKCRVTVVTAVPHYPLGRIPADYRGRLLSVEEELGCRVVRVWVPPLPSRGMLNRVLLFFTFSLMSLLGIAFSSGVEYVWAANPNIISFFPAMVYGFLRSCPVVQNVDDLWPEVPVQLGMMSSPLVVSVARCVAGYVYRRADALTPISSAYVDVITREYAVPPDRVHVVPGGVDTDVFKPGDLETNGFFTILYIGSFSPTYDFECVLKAADLLQKQDDIKFVLQGAGETLDNVCSSVAEMRLSNVEVINKIVSRKEVAETLRSADVLLLPLGGSPSVQQGISSKLYEYQAVGKPIICCSNGMPGKFVSETGSGLVVRPGDFEDMVNAVLFLNNNMDVAKKLGDAGRGYVEINLSVCMVGVKMRGIFRGIVAR